MTSVHIYMHMFLWYDPSTRLLVDAGHRCQQTLLGQLLILFDSCSLAPEMEQEMSDLKRMKQCKTVWVFNA